MVCGDIMVEAGEIGEFVGTLQVGMGSWVGLWGHYGWVWGEGVVYGDITGGDGGGLWRHHGWVRGVRMVCVMITVVFVWTPNAETEAERKGNSLFAQNRKIHPAKQAKTGMGRRSWWRHWRTRGPIVILRQGERYRREEDIDVSVHKIRSHGGPPKPLSEERERAEKPRMAGDPGLVPPLENGRADRRRNKHPTRRATLGGR